MNGPIHRDYNTSTLRNYGYSIYSNGTLSNGTNCYLTFGEFHPTLFTNGSFANSTGCDYPYYDIKSRGAIGMTWSILMIALLPVSVFCLRKHGRQYLEEKKRFRRFSRKWQWYWLLLLQALSAIAGFFSMDVDRSYIQGSSLTAYGAIYCATLPVALATGWELTRHWGSFEERKLHDEDPFRFHHGDTRSKVHLGMPLIFYLFGFLTFFMTVLRNWNSIKSVDAANAVDGRWKAGGFFAIIAWVQIWAQIVVTRIYYKVPRVPLVIPAVLLCLAALLAFHLAYMWDYEFSPFNTRSSVVFVALLGYLPSLLIVVVMQLSGLARENEDRVILSLRTERDRTQTAALIKQTQEIQQQRHRDADGDDDVMGSHKEEKNGTKVGISTETTVQSTKSSTSFTSSQEGYSEGEAQKQTKFFKFFGAAPMKGKTWLSHNMKYLPFTRQNEKDKLSKLEPKGHFWKRSRSSSLAPAAQGAAGAASPLAARPPPRDIRDNWKVKTVTGR